MKSIDPNEAYANDAGEVVIVTRVRNERLIGDYSYTSVFFTNVRPLFGVTTNEMPEKDFRVRFPYPAKNSAILPPVL